MSESLFSLGLQLYQKGDSGTGVFQGILRNFKEHLLLQNTPVAASVSHHAKEILSVSEFKLCGKPIMK